MRRSTLEEDMNVHQSWQRRRGDWTATRVKQIFATDGVDDRGARDSHHLMNEDGDLLLQGLLLGQKMQEHPEAVASCCWRCWSCKDKHHHLVFTFSCLKPSPAVLIHHCWYTPSPVSSSFYFLPSPFNSWLVHRYSYPTSSPSEGPR